jgi:hypothetical protein
MHGSCPQTYLTQLGSAQLHSANLQINYAALVGATAHSQRFGLLLPVFAGLKLVCMCETQNTQQDHSSQLHNHYQAKVHMCAA